MSHKSILAHLAPLLTNQIENLATDALAHVLLEYPFLAAGLREHLGSTGVNLPENVTIKTQARWQDAAIPDLVGLDDHGRSVLIVESKFWAGLTPNQPATYVARLPPDVPGLLLFIAPASRIPILWRELLHRCGHSPVDSESQPGAANLDFLTLRLNDRHLLSLTSWDSILGVLYERAVGTEDRYAAADIWELQSLCTTVDQGASKPFAEEELVSPTKMRIAQFRILINDLVDQLVESGIASIAGYHAAPAPNYYRRYLSINKHVNWCIEVNEQYPKRDVTTHIWLTKWGAAKLSPPVEKLDAAGFYHGKRYLIPLSIPVGVVQDAVVTSLFDQVAELARRLVEISSPS